MNSEWSYSRTPLELGPPPGRFLVRISFAEEVRTVSWLVIVLGLVAGLIGGCSSGAGSAMTGPSSQTSTQPAGSEAARGEVEAGSAVAR